MRLIRMSKQKDVIRKFIEAHLPGLRKSSLKKETEMLEEFVANRDGNPRSVMYSRNFLEKTENAGYHLERLRKAGALETSHVDPVKVLVDLAAEGRRRTNRGMAQIRRVRQLRTARIIEHANGEPAVLAAMMAALGTGSIEETESIIAFSEDFDEDRIRLAAYNKAVYAIKKAGLETIQYDYLYWRNAAKPWKLTDDFIYHLRDNGIKMEV